MNHKCNEVTPFTLKIESLADMLLVGVWVTFGNDEAERGFKFDTLECLLGFSRKIHLRDHKQIQPHNRDRNKKRPYGG